MIKLYRIEDVAEMTSLSKASIYKQIRLGTFPKPIKLDSRTNAWTDEQLEEWVKSRIELSQKEHA
jgi:prophage regulatory protein